MRVRVYDKNTGTYFKSEVYAIFNTGIYSQYVVLVPSNEKAYLRLFNVIDTSKGTPYRANINVITPETPDNWITKGSFSSMENNLMPDITTPETKFYFYKGYSWLFDDKKILSSLITGDAVAFDETESQTKVCSEIEGWTYVETQRDIEALLKEFNGFHDSVLISLNYISGASVDEEGRMSPCDSVRRITMFSAANGANPSKWFSREYWH